MILTTIISFLGGNVMRMLVGELFAKWTEYQNHKQEIELIKLQNERDAAQHARNLESLKVQADLGVKEIRVRAEGAVSEVEANAWASAVEATTRPTGIWLVDLWNGAIRPGGATFFLILIGMHFHEKQWVLDEQGWALAGAFLGIYVADRQLFKRGR